jgi:hypothetical protein
VRDYAYWIIATLNSSWLSIKRIKTQPVTHHPGVLKRRETEIVSRRFTGVSRRLTKGIAKQRETLLNIRLTRFTSRVSQYGKHRIICQIDYT